MMTDPPPWLPAGMDASSSFLMNIKIVGPQFREGIGGYRFDMVIDFDTMNYKDFLAEIEEKYLWRMNETVTLNYFEESNRTIHELSTDHDMLAKFGSKKTIEMRITVHDVNARPDKPKWPIEESVGVDVPCTLSLPCAPPNPPQASSSQRSNGTHHREHSPNLVGTDLANPYEENEHVGVDEEDMYSDDSDNEGGASDVSCKDSDFVPEVREESSDDDMSEDEEDDIKDAEPDDIPDFSYDRENPPMTEGTIYSDMHEFRMAIVQHAIAHEFDFEIDKTDPSRFRVHCCDENCKWRIHAARLDEGGIKVVVNKDPHTCSSIR